MTFQRLPPISVFAECLESQDNHRFSI
jgi:hypothetical protein